MLIASLLLDVACFPPPIDPIPSEASLPWGVEDDRVPPVLPGRFMNSTELDTLPRLGVLDGWDPDTEHRRPTWRPICVSEQSPDATASLHPVMNDGWVHWEDPDGQTNPYLTTQTPGARATFEIEVGDVGRVEVYSMRSRDLGLGSVRCWVNQDDDQGVKIVGYWDNDA